MKKLLEKEIEIIYLVRSNRKISEEEKLKNENSDVLTTKDEYLDDEIMNSINESRNPEDENTGSVDYSRSNEDQTTLTESLRPVSREGRFYWNLS